LNFERERRMGEVESGEWRVESREWQRGGGEDEDEDEASGEGGA
jgi:hypothetical protein